MRIITLIENTPGAPGCVHEHGLSLYVETARHTLLMDTGATGAFADNAAALGLDLSRVDTVVLSHGHYDHAGGLLRLVELAPHARIYMQRGAGRDFYHGDRYIGIDKAILDLPNLHLLDGDCRLDEELFLFAGITGRRFWPRSNLELRTTAPDGTPVQDDFSHEQCLVIAQEGKHILLSGCAHNGILNILDRYRQLFGADPDVAVSGFHMKQADPYTPEQWAVIDDTARELARYHTRFYTGHCTGKPAQERLLARMGDQLHPLHSGLPLDL